MCIRDRDSMTMSAFRLSANIAGGDTSVARAVTALKKELGGLTLADLQKLSQDEQWNKVVGALHAVENEGIRNRLGIQLMGRTYAEAVSYTHLRAHETGRNLVCRLLL